MKILIADDHWIVRESLKNVMKLVQKSFEPYEATTFDEALSLLRDHPDMELMLIDLIMPGFEEFAGLRRLRTEFPAVPIVVVSVHEDPEYVLQSINHGVIGYIPKTAGGAEIVRAITLVLNGDVSFPRHILENARSAGTEFPRGGPAPALHGQRLDDLTSRERDVLKFLGAGYSNGRIAEQLRLNQSTVRVHVRNVIGKLGLKDRSEVIHYAAGLNSPA